MPRPPLPTTRRTAMSAAGVLGLSGLAGALGACSDNDASAGDARGDAGRTAPGRDPDRATGAGSEDGPEDGSDPDTLLVDRVAREIERVRAQVRTEARAHPSVAGELRRLERLHTRHAAELGPRPDPRSSDRDDRASDPAPSRRPGQVLPRLARAESRLQGQLGAASLEARSGGLALLLASMAAGVAQERSLL